MGEGRSSKDLLHELHIDRDEREGSGPHGPRWPWIVGGVVVVLVVAGMVAAIALRGRAVAVETVTAVPAATGAGQAAVLQATGYVVARRQATVSAQIIGTLTEVSVEEGEHVTKGQVLARLEDAQYKAQLHAAEAQEAAAEAQIAQAQASLDQARDNARRLNAVVAHGYVSKQAAEQANTQVAVAKASQNVAVKQAEAAAAQVKAAQINYDYTIVRAPFDGVVTDKAAQVGEIVSPYSSGNGFTRTGVATIVDMGSLEVDVDVNEAYISRVKPGMKVEAVLDAYPDWKVPAHVIAIIPSADRSKATVKVRVALEKKDPRILPEMGVRVSFLEQAADDAKPLTGVLVPKSAIVGRAGEDVVFVVSDGRAQRTPVTTGKDFSDMQQITHGIAAGAEVVKAPKTELKDGGKVEVKAEGGH